MTTSDIARSRPGPVAAILLFLAAVHAPGVLAREPQAGGPMMPDPKQMSGIPLPVGDVAAGTVTVRLIRGSLSNPITNHDVELQGPPTALRSKTNEAGRAEFAGLQPGTRVKAVAVVADERLESQEFEIPSAAGIRVMLVAADPDSSAAGRTQEPARKGTVVLGDQSRFVVEFNDDGLSVFSILQIQNDAGVPVEAAAPLIFDIPEGAEGPGVVEGSSPQAALSGRQFVVTGPFAPGATLVQFGYSMPVSDGSLTVAQRMPLPMTRLTVLAQKVGDTHLTSPQLSSQREMHAEGQTYIVAQGPALEAGDVVTLDFTGLPHPPVWPRNLALALALVILAAGAWGSMRRGAGPAGAAIRRQELETRRDRLFGDLATLEEQHRAGRLEEEPYTAKRRRLVGALERIYAELDEEAAA